MSLNPQEVAHVTTADANQRPTYTCRHCGQPAEVLWQPPLLPERPGFYYITCWNACALKGYTFSSVSYSTIDLSNYLKKEQS